jgi:hypothetical protein
MVDARRWWIQAALALAAAACSSGGDAGNAPGAGGNGGAGASGSPEASSSSAGALASVGAGGFGGGGVRPFSCDPPAAPGSLYEHSAVSYDIDEIDPVSMCKYRGDVLLIANTAAL